MRRDYAPLEDCNFMVDQMQMVCRGGERTPANKQNVGRSSMNYLEGKFSGQCTKNALVGSWYSFASIGECAPGWAIGFQGCTWKTQDFKVVTSSCVIAQCKQTALDAEKTGGIIVPSVLDCLTSAIASCPDQ